MKWLVLALVIMTVCAPLSAAERRPNIIVIMSDDMGYSDLGCYGGEINTPTLDSLAAGGLRFTQFYNTARCCPTRASLLTGLYPHQAGIGHMMEDKGLDGYRGDLNRNCLTIAEALQAGRLRDLCRRQMARHAAREARRPQAQLAACSAASIASTARSPAPAASTIPARWSATTR